MLYHRQEKQKTQHINTEKQPQLQQKHQEQHRLTAISCPLELQELRDLYRKDWPEHCVGYLTLDNFLRWLQKEPEIKNLYIYTLNGDWRHNGLFLIVDRYQLFVNTLCTKSDNGEGNELLTKAISLLNWTPGYKVSSFLERHRSAVVSVVSELNLQKEYDSLTLVYHMPAATAAELNVNCPIGYTLRPMAITDAAIVDKVWPNQHQGSLFLIKRLIAWNINMGVYVEETNELVAWCLRLQGGFLGALQVKDTHKRLGLGSLVTAATSRRTARELGQDVTACVGADNVPSKAVFKKLGFKDRYQLFINSLKSNTEAVSQALKLIDWAKGYKITTIPIEYYSTVVSHVKELNLKWAAAKMVIYHMSQTAALKLQVDCPTGFQLQSLNISDAPIVDELWPPRHEGSLYFIKRLIEHNPSMGLYLRDTQELVAWCTRCQSGFLGTLQVQNAYKRRGFASLVVKAYALQLAKSGQDILTLAYEHNVAAHQLFLKLGFQAHANAHHMKAFRSEKGIEWSEDP